MDAGTHLAAITRILERDFPLVSTLDVPVSTPLSVYNDRGADNGGIELHSPGTALHSDDESGPETPLSERDAPVTITTLKHGSFAGLPFPYASARANALHLVREHVSTYLITHPHLDHVSGFVINTAAFHNTSRPKRVAALPFTVNALKKHVFNDIIWPNLTDEDGGVGLVTFQRLAEGGNIALGEGSSRGFIEVCDGLSVKGFKVSHGNRMGEMNHVHHGTKARMAETPGKALAASGQQHILGAEVPDGRSQSLSIPTPSAPGTPGIAGLEQGRRASAAAAPSYDHCMTDSTAYFIRADSTLTTPKREVLLFGDVEPDSLSLSPRTAHIWAEAAPKIAAGILKGIFIEVSYTNATGDAVLFGHLAPRHLLAELTTLGEMVREARKDYERAREGARRGRKRKRAANALHFEFQSPTGEPRRVKTMHLGPVGKAIDSPLSGIHPLTDDEFMTDFPPSQNDTGTHTPVPSGSHPAAPPALNLSALSNDHNKALLAAALEAPLKGVKVVVIHVKDTFVDGPLVGEQILRELMEGEEALQEAGKGLGCSFEVSKGGESYWF